MSGIEEEAEADMRAAMRAGALEASRSDLARLEAAGYRVWAAFEERPNEHGGTYRHALGWRVLPGDHMPSTDGFSETDFATLLDAQTGGRLRR